MLEKLRIAVNMIYGGDTRPGQPSQLTTFQPWNLPRLKLLQLSNLAALLFNYNSFKTTPPLTVLSLTAMSGPIPISIAAKTKMWRSINKVPRLAGYLPPRFRIRDQTQTGLVLQKKRTVDWSLPNLTTILLRGPPTMTFSMDWLKCCSVLDMVLLKIDHEYFQPLSLHAPKPVK